MASGPAKKNRNRHLEVFNNQVLISVVIDACKIENVETFCVIASNNNELKSYVQEQHPLVKILHPKSLSMFHSFEAAFNCNSNDALIIAGDLRKIRKRDVLRFITSPYPNAIYSLKTRWGKPLISVDGKLIRRSDVGDSIVLIENGKKSEYLSPNNISKAKEYFNRFYPKQPFIETKGNHLWTWLDYVFFNEIMGSKTDIQESKMKDLGCIYMDHLIFADND